MHNPFAYISSCALGLLALTAPLNAESLWLKAGHRERSMFADYRASQRGDILTIIVAENSSMANNLSLSTSRETQIQHDLARLLFTDILSRNGETPSTNLTFGPNEHNGQGSIQNSQTLTARISVTVMDVLPNGNLVLEGVRMISYSGETYYMLTQGICRPRDVSTTNSISSTLVADARIEIVHEGALTEAQHKGWLSRWVDKISP